MTEEIRTFYIWNDYMDNKQDKIVINIRLDDIVTIRIGDWYFEGKVKRKV